MSLAAGTAFWALIPYTPQAPFRVYASGREPLEVASVHSFIDGLKKRGDAEFGFVVRAKPRPILLLSGRTDPRTGDLLGLRTVRLSKLTDAERAQVLRHEQPRLFHLGEDRFPGLAEEAAAMVSAPVRVHASAVDERTRLGELDENELRALHERFATYWQLDLRDLILDKIRLLQDRGKGA